jgi:PKD repeat protein
MSLTKNISVTLTRNGIDYDITDGIIAIDGLYGIDYYTGISQLPDVGQLTIVSRNAGLDPYINENVRFNSQITVTYDDEWIYSQTIFTAYITDINVEYGAHGQDTIITINAIDQLGLYQRHKFTKDFSDYVRTTYPSGINIIELINELNKGAEIENFSMILWNEFLSPYNPVPEINFPLAKTAIQEGVSFWDTFTLLAQSSYFKLAELGGSGAYALVPDIKYTKEYPEFWGNPTENYPSPDFASDHELYPYSTPYKTILVDDGFQRTTNQVEITNNSVTFAPGGYDDISQSFGPYISQESMQEWGSTRLSLGTLFSGAENTITTFDNLGFDLIERDGQPKLDIAEITIDGQKYIESINWPQGTVGWDWYSPVVVAHKINNDLSIQKVYGLVGLKYSITPDSFFITLVLKESSLYAKYYGQIAEPQISINSLTGDTNFNFSASITGYPVDKIARVDWEVGGAFQDASDILNNPTPTWNYDPDVPPLDWQGPGIKQVWAVVTNTDGWKVKSNVITLDVTAAVPYADFTYTESYGTVAFTDASFDADTWLWNFDDGTTSTLQNPTHHFLSNDTFNVQLQISNGVLTDTITKPITIDLSKIECNYVKFEWSGTATVTGGVQDKYWLEKVNYIDLPLTSGYGPTNLDNYANVDKVVTTGNVYNADGTTVWAAGQNTWDLTGALTRNADQILTDKSKFTTPVWIKPQVSGSTRTYGSSLIIKPREMLDLSQFGQTPYTSQQIVENIINTRLYFLKNSWVTGRTYQPINVYVSADATNWYQVGTTGTFVGPAQIPSGVDGALLVGLEPTVPMPPFYP